MENLGKRLRALRKERGLTLAQLGQQAGLSVSYLSQVERGRAMPSLAKVSALARALAVEVRDLFEEESTHSCIVRSAEGARVLSAPGLFVDLLSGDLVGKGILPYQVTCQPGTLYEWPSDHAGEECGLVLRGQLTVTIGEEKIVLRAGDSIHYQRDLPHSWRNEGDEECVVIWATSPPLIETELQG